MNNKLKINQTLPKVVNNKQLKVYIKTNPKTTSRKMSAKFSYAQNTIINHFYHLNYVNIRCQDMSHDLNDNQTEKQVIFW